MHLETPRAVAPGSALPVRVRALRAEDALRWRAWVERAPTATFFHRLEWRGILEDCFGHQTHYLVAERGDAMVGALPLAEVRSRLFGNTLTSLPFCVYGGPAADDDEALQALVAEAEALGASLRVDHLELRGRTSVCPQWPQSDLYVTFRREIQPDVEANMLAIPRKQRAMVRKGIKHGLASEIDTHAGRFFDLYADNVHRHGTPPQARSYFERLMAAFGDDCEVLTVVSPGGQPVSSVLSFRFRDEILPYYAGDNVDARDLAANDFKYWEVMRRACERGLRVFDYGRSKRGTGSFDFKKNWGFEPAPLYYAFRLYRGGGVPQQNPLNPKYRAMIAVWRRLPRPVANALGPHVVRGLG
jgi:FemAB-related protein (PEP-CTERM system-associated)